jgi:excisionase family DNA binding protein
MLQVAEKTVYRWIREGDLEAQRLGSHQRGLRVSQEALDTFMRPAYTEDKQPQRVA